MNVIMSIVAPSCVTTAEGNGAYVSDVAVVCPVLIAHLRNATRAWAFSWVIPFGYTSNS